MKKKTCSRCSFPFVRTKPVNVRVVFGIHAGAKPVFEKAVRHWCGSCRVAMDGKWRYAK